MAMEEVNTVTVTKSEVIPNIVTGTTMDETAAARADTETTIKMRLTIIVHYKAGNHRLF